MNGFALQQKYLDLQVDGFALQQKYQHSTFNQLNTECSMPCFLKADMNEICLLPQWSWQSAGWYMIIPGWSDRSSPHSWSLLPLRHTAIIMIKSNNSMLRITVPLCGEAAKSAASPHRWTVIHKLNQKQYAQCIMNICGNISHCVDEQQWNFHYVQCA